MLKGWWSCAVKTEITHKCILEGTDTVEDCFKVVAIEIKLTKNFFLYISCIKSATLIDNIFTNNLGNEFKNFILIDDITDHLPVFIVVSGICKVTDNEVYFTKRKISNSNVNRLLTKLQTKVWDELFSYDDVNKSYEFF